MNKKYKLREWVKVMIVLIVYLSLLIPIIDIRNTVKNDNADCFIIDGKWVCIYD